MTGSLNSFGQINFQQVLDLTSKNEFDKAESLAKAYLKQNPTHAHAYEFMGTIYESKVPSKKNLDSALYYYTRAAENLTEAQVLYFKTYYPNYNRRDIRTGQFTVKMTDVAYGLETRIKSLNNRLSQNFTHTDTGATTDKQTKPTFESQLPDPALIMEERVALVIGNKNYQTVQPLGNTMNDALDMATALKAKGFTVISLFDAKNKSEVRAALIKFSEALQNKENGVGLFYYSGHGMQVEGVNYLIPVQANLQIKADIDDQCVNMDYVLRTMEAMNNKLNIIILDACRNNPFRSFSRSGERGLTSIDAPKGSYIVYSTKPGYTASDGTGRNGLFTSKLLKYIRFDNLSLEQVFKNVAAEVGNESGDAQRPWVSSDFTGEFYFSIKK